MARLLYIQASPRGKRSYCLAAADAFVESYKQSHPKDKVVVVNVFTENLPVFDGPALESKYAILHGQDKTPEQVKAWKAVEAVIEGFKSADKYVIASPMWNFGIPYRLKQYVDILVQPSYTFSYSPTEGYKGLVTGKPCVLVLARGGAYPSGSNLDMQKSYLELVLGFLGFKGIQSIVVEPTMADKDKAEAMKSTAIEQAKRLAAAF